MILREWTDFVKALDRYFERKSTEMTTIALWFDEVKNLPGEFLSWASSQLRELEFFPRNLPLKVKALWHEWLKANPQKKAKEDDECPGCAFGQGWISIWKTHKLYADLPNPWIRTAVRCAICNPFPDEYLANLKKRGMSPERIGTISDLEEAGIPMGISPPGGYQFKPLREKFIENASA